MSKSKGEFLTVNLLESKGYDPMVYRMFCLQSHYRKSLVFSYENLDNMAIAYNKLIAKIATLKDGEPVDEAAFAEQKAGFVKALDNDLNTSLAVTALYDALKANTNDATKLALIREYDQVLCLNLLENAVVHAVGMTQLQLQITQKQNKIWFEIRDNGFGIPEERMENLFQGYQSREDVPADGNRHNMGIGLSVCAAIVRAHGGEIQAANNPEGGASFSFWLELEEEYEQ